MDDVLTYAQEDRIISARFFERIKSLGIGPVQVGDSGSCKLAELRYICTSVFEEISPASLFADENFQQIPADLQDPKS